MNCPATDDFLNSTRHVVITGMYLLPIVASFLAIAIIWLPNMVYFFLFISNL